MEPTTAVIAPPPLHQPVWTLDSALLSRAAACAPELRRLSERFDRRLPVADSHLAYRNARMFRLPGSHRSYYFALGSPAGEDGVVAFKGSEPLGASFGKLLADLRRRCYTPHSVAQHLVIEEGKIPGCMSLSEALAEAHASALVHERHLQRYGEVARVPLALKVYRLDEPTGQAAEEAIRELLEPAAQRRLTELTAGGLGVLVYHYPAPPIRVRDLSSTLPTDFRARQLRLRRLLSPEHLVPAWVRLFTRLLALGLLPGGLASGRTGVCCQPQNACLDGGFVDLDSVVEITADTGPRELRDGLEVSLEALVDTVQALLVSDVDGQPTWSESVTRRRIAEWVQVLLREALADESRRGAGIPFELASLLAAPRSYVDLIDQVSPLHDSAASDTRTAAEAFSRNAEDLLATALRAPGQRDD